MASGFSSLVDSAGYAVGLPVAAAGFDVFGTLDLADEDSDELVEAAILALYDYPYDVVLQQRGADLEEDGEFDEAALGFVRVPDDDILRGEPGEDDEGTISDDADAAMGTGQTSHDDVVLVLVDEALLDDEPAQVSELVGSLCGFVPDELTDWLTRARRRSRR